MLSNTLQEVGNTEHEQKPCFCALNIEHIPLQTPCETI